MAVKGLNYRFTVKMIKLYALFRRNRYGNFSGGWVGGGEPKQSDINVVFNSCPETTQKL